MSGLKVRRIPWEFEGVDFLWNPQMPAFSVMLNTISFLAIGLEKYFCRAMSDADAVIRDPAVLEEARLFSCGITWNSSRDKSRGERRALDSVDLHDRGGRARFRTPDGRELSLELHGRDWPLSTGRESLVLILRGASASGDPIASSWTSLDAARVGIDIGWLAIDCAPVISATGEQHS